MRKQLVSLLGTGIFSAGLMYYFDPERGRRRRRLLSRQFTDAGYRLQTGVSDTARDVRRRARDTWPSAKFESTGFRLRRRGRTQALAGRLRARAGTAVSRINSLEQMSLKKRSMRNRLWALAGIGTASAGIMYYLDPERGRRRRNQVRDRAVRAGHQLRSCMSKAGSDIRNRAAGIRASLRGLFGLKRSDDTVLAERVRAQLGRIISHPGSIEVTAENGHVTLSGPVLEQEVEQLIRQVYSVEGVTEVESRLEVHTESGRIPGLQGAGTQREGARSNIFRQSEWPPAARVLAGAAGAGALAGGVLLGRSRETRALWPGIAASIAGSLLIARSATNMELRRLTGIGARRRAIDVQKSIRIQAPVQRVFAVWADFENFPTFMSHVRQVRRMESDPRGTHWRWTVDGPAGTEVEFDVVVTTFETDRVLAWRTEGPSLVQHAGRVIFTDNKDGSTTIKIRMSYNPVAGAMGHAVARIFGADPKHQMDDDLLRMKTFIETGKPPHDAAAPQQAPSPAAAPAPSGPLH